MDSPPPQPDQHRVNFVYNTANNKNKETQTQVPIEMRAQVQKTCNPPRKLVNLPTPILTSSIDPHDVSIKLTAAFYCRTGAGHILTTAGIHTFPPHFLHVECHNSAGIVVALSSHHTPDPNNPSILEVGGRVNFLCRAFHSSGSCFKCYSAPTGDNQNDDNDQDKPGHPVYCPHVLGHGISSPGDFQDYLIIDSGQVAPIPRSISDLRMGSSGGQGNHLHALDPRAHFFLLPDMSECTPLLLSSLFSIGGGPSRRQNESFNSLPVSRHSRNPDDLRAAMTPKHSSKTLAPWSAFQDGSLMTITAAGWGGILASFVSCALQRPLCQLHRQLRGYGCQATLAYFVRCGAAPPSPAPDRFGCVTTQNPHPGAGMLTGFPFATRGTSYPLKMERGGQAGPGGVSLLRQLRSMAMPPPRYEGGWVGEM